MKKVLILLSLALLLGLVTGCPDPVTPTPTPEVVVAPSFTPADENTVVEGAEITLTSTTEGASVYYTSGESDFSVDEWTLYDETAKPAVAFGSNQTVTYKAIAVKAGMTNSSVVSATYTLQGTVVTPSITPTSGEIDFTTAITLSTTTEEATIHYTVDGSEPTTASTNGTSVDISALTSPVTVKAIAVKAGMTNSSVVSATYTKATVAEPVIETAGGRYDEGNLSISIVVPTGANVYYTVDGSEPSASSTEFTAAFNITISTTLVEVKAIAVKAGMTNSGVVSAEYKKAFVKPSDLTITTVGTMKGIIGGDYQYQGSIEKEVESFYLGETEVTQFQWETVMKDVYGEGSDLWPDADPSSDYGLGADRPAYYVSWEDAIVFCNALSRKEGLIHEQVYYEDVNSNGTYDEGTDTAIDKNSRLNNGENVVEKPKATGYRLPTEVEWEYAAGHGGFEADGTTPKARTVYAGTSVDGNVEGTDDLGDYAWYSSNNGASGTETYGSKDVGTKKANALGLHDMNGNVWEWCYDKRSDTSYIRAVRGGGWHNFAWYCLVADRYYDMPSSRSETMGFRVARSVE